MKQNNIKTKNNLIYGVNDNPNLLTKILLGFQHIFAAFGGIIVVPLVISSSLGFDPIMSTAVISASILAAGIATIIQANGVGKVGSQVACIMGTDFTFVSPAISVGSVLGLPGIIGATILGAFFEIILSYFIKPLMKLFPPIVTGTVVCLIGLTLIPVSMDWAAGGVGSDSYGSLLNVSISIFVMIITLFLNKYGKGILSSASILIGMVVGYLICIPLGLVDFSAVKDASFVSIPKIFEYGVTFDLKALIAFLPAYFVTTIETVGCLKAIGEVSNVDMNDKRVGSGVLADGVGSIFGGVVGAFPNTSFSQNVGLIPLTKVASKHVAVMAGILLVVLGLFPKFAALINGIPQPVLGGVGIVMFGTVAAAGIKTLSKVEINDRNLLIIATSIGLGLGVTFRPDFISNLPEGLQMVFSSGISTGTIVALVLNIVLKDDKNNEVENIKDLEIPLYTYAINKEADFMAKDINITASGLSYKVKTPEYEDDIFVPVPGMFTVYNTLTVIAVGYVLGIDKEIIKESLRNTKGVPGRFEAIQNDKGIHVIIDYAHTPDALENVITTARGFAKGKIITVFGCGGDRDSTKRPIMGSVADKLSDVAILTSDNPRTEDPDNIIKDVLKGMNSDTYKVIADRRSAICEAINMAEKDDIVLIAGKGHEDYQEIKGVKYHFDEREAVAEILDEMKAGKR